MPLARIRGTKEVIDDANAEQCFGCAGLGMCSCVACSEDGKLKECVACMGTGWLTWPKMEKQAA